MATAGNGSVASSSASSTAAVVSSASHFRRLAWQASVTVKVRLDHPSAASNDLNVYYLQVPRYTYLALLVPELRDCFVNLLLSVKDRAEHKETDWWFEYDVGQEGESSSGPSQTSLGACRWHWPLDQHHLHSQLHLPHPAPSYFQSPLPNQSATLNLILHLSNPPQTNTYPDIDSVKASFVAQLKEADFVRWGNTRKITSLRRQDLEAAWEGVVGDDFDLHSRFTSKILPLPVPAPTVGASNESSSSGAKAESVYSCRALPIKIYLPDDAPVIQEIVSPLGSDGKPTTMIQLLRTHLPLLFPNAYNPYSLAVPSMHGVPVPPESDVAWLSSCVCGADGWLRIAIRLIADQ